MKNELGEIFSAMHYFPGGVGSNMPSSRILAGEHKSSFIGRGLDLYRIVEYDPWRHTTDQIIWNRTNDPEKVYVREAVLLKEMNVVLILDLSSSLSFGVHFQAKQRLLLETAGAVGITAAHNHDKVAWIGFTSEIVFKEPPKSEERRVYYVVQKTHSFLTSGDTVSRRTDFGKALHFLSKRFTRRCIVFIFSDFVGWEHIVDVPMFRSLAVRHDIVCVILDDPEEFNIKGMFGTVRVRGREDDKKKTVVVPVRRFRKIRREIIEQRTRMREGFKRLGVDSLELVYGNHLECLGAFLGERRKG